MAYEPEEYVFCPMTKSECRKHKCAWWMVIQHACAVEVLARIHGILKEEQFKRKLLG